MDPQLMMMMMASMGQGGGQYQHPLARAFGGTPMFGGTPIMPSQMFDMSGMPGIGGSQMGNVAGMLMQGVLPGLMGPNFIPGQFAPTQNIYDHKMAVNHFMQRRKAIEVGSEADQETYFRMVRGMARMSGIEYEDGSEQEAAARRFSKDLTVLGPILGDIMPELFDQAHGIRGSSSMMARNMFEGSRYTFDPSSGRLGMSGESAGMMNKEVFRQLYGEGADLSKMKGIGAGRSGQMYDEMIRRGVGPRSLSPEQTKRELGKELDKPIENIASSELRELKLEIQKGTKSLESLDPQAFEAASRSFNATKVAESIKNMSGAIAAMKDIFGDMGRPNAPMVELMNGLNTLTQGGLATMSPQQIEHSVRTTYAMAKYTGIGLEGLMGLAGNAGQMLDQQGMNRALAPDIANSAVAFGFAAGLAGQPKNIGALDKEMQTQLDLRLRTNAAKSPLAARLATVARFSDEFQRVDENGQKVTGFDEGSEAYALSQAIKNRQSTYDYGGKKGISVFKSQADTMAILGKVPGLSKDEVAASLFADPNVQADVIKKYDIADTVREGQGNTDLQRYYGNYMANSFGMSLTKNLKMDPNKAKNLAMKLGGGLNQEAQKLIEEDPELLSGGREVERNVALGQRLRARFGKQLEGVDDSQLENMINAAWRASDAGTMRQGSGLNMYKSYTGALQMNNKRAFELANRTKGEIAGITRLQSVLAGVGQEGLVSRISDYLQEVGPGGGSIKDLAFKALGGREKREITDPLASLLTHVASLQKNYEDAGNIGDPGRRKVEQERILDDIKRISPDIAQLFGGSMDKLSPEAVDIIKKSRDEDAKRTGKPAEEMKMTPEQEMSLAARTAYREERDKELEKRAPVADAKKERDAAATKRDETQKMFSMATQTPAVRKAYDRLAQIGKERESIDAKLKETTDPAERRKLEAQKSQILRSQNAASNEYQNALGRELNKPEVKALSAEKDKAQKDYTAAQGKLGEVIKKEGEKVDAAPTPELLGKKAAYDDARKAADPKKSGTPGIPGASNVSTGPTTIKDSKVEITDSKEIKLSAQAVTITKVEKDEKGSTGGPVDKEQKITGTLRIEGDVGYLDASVPPMTDTRTGTA